MASTAKKPSKTSKRTPPRNGASRAKAKTKTKPGTRTKPRASATKTGTRSNKTARGATVSGRGTHATIRRDPVSGTAGDAASDVMDVLHNEHKYLDTLLRGLEHQLGTLKPGGSPNYKILRDMVHYLSHYPDEYHHPREELLFDRLEPLDDSIGEDIDHLRFQHRQIAQQSRDLTRILGHILAGKRKPENAQLKLMLRRYLNHYRDHIGLEESSVFPAAKSRLSKADWREINRSSQSIDDPLFGPRVRREYQQLAGFLNGQIDIAIEDIALAEVLGVEAMLESSTVMWTALSELKTVLGEHGRRSWRENLDLSKSVLDRDGECTFRQWPASWLSKSMKRWSDSGREAKRVLDTARQEFSEPYSAWMNTMKNVLR